MKEFKIRCSAASNIMAGSNGLTDKQLETIKTLEDKAWDRTEKQEITLNDLIHKRDNPELPEGAKTYCKDWLKGQLFNYKKVLKNKFIDKGNIMEDESIDFICDQLGLGFLLKNEEHFEDDYMQGTPDIILKDLIIDTKNSWDCSTYPFFDETVNPDYYWQLQGYMHLTGRSKAKLIYCLMDTPEHLIYKEARFYSMSLGHDDLEESIYEDFERNMTYKNVPDRLKIKVIDIEKNNDDIANIMIRVEMCREFIKQLKSEIK